MKKVILVNLAFLLAGFVIAEVIFGSWFKDENYGYLTIPRDLTITSQVDHLYDGSGEITHTRDKHGFRGAYGQPKDIDLLVLGGSTANELYVDDCCTWPRLVSKLAANEGIDLKVASAGVDGQSSIGHIWNFDIWFSKIPDLNPKYILAYMGVNEREVNPSEQANQGLLQHSDFSRRLKQYVRNNSAVYNLVKLVSGTIKAHEKQLFHSKVDYQNAEWESKTRDEFAAMACASGPQKAYEERLENLAGKISAMGARPIFVNQTRGDSYWQGDVIKGVKTTKAIEKTKLLSCFNETLMAFCGKKQIYCIDLANQVDLSPEDFYDSVHTNPKGSKKVAQTIYAGIRGILGNRF